MELTDISTVKQQIQSAFTVFQDEPKSYIDDTTNEAVIEYNVNYNTLNKNAPEFEQELRQFGSTIGATVNVSEIGFDSITVQFRFENWDLS
jgi:uncharacterized protein YukE